MIRMICPHCGSINTTRCQWVDNDLFEYWACWSCMAPFVVPIKVLLTEARKQLYWLLAECRELCKLYRSEQCDNECDDDYGRVPECRYP